MLGIPSDAECGEKGDEEQRGKHWRSYVADGKGGWGRKEKGRKGKKRKGKGEASEKARIELGKKDVKRIGCLERSTLLSSLCTRRLKLSYQHLDKKPAQP